MSYSNGLRVIHPNAIIGKNVTISPFTVIEEDVIIGDNTWIGPNVTIFNGVLLKEHKQADFFLLVDEAAPLTPEELIDHVRKTEFVLMAFPLDGCKERGAHKLLQ